MSEDHRRYLIVEQGVGPAIFNFLLNALIASGLYHALDVVPLEGPQSVAGDTVATGVLLPFLSCLIVTAVVRRHVAGGRLAPLAVPHPAVAWMPRNTVLRAILFAVLTCVTLVPLTLRLFAALGVTGMGFWWFVLYKAAWAAMAAFILTPLIALWAIAAPPRPATA